MPPFLKMPGGHQALERSQVCNVAPERPLSLWDLPEAHKHHLHGDVDGSSCGLKGHGNYLIKSQMVSLVIWDEG